jgi:LPXTG-motif cell wall-anchored protein
MTVLLAGLLLASTAADAKTGCPKDDKNSHGNQYPPGQCKPKTSSSSAPQGGAITIAGEGFAAGEPVQVQFDDGTVLTVTATSTGAASATVQIPAGAGTGAHVLALFGTRSGQYLNTTITVTPASSRPVLAHTGASSVVPMAGAGAGLVLAGGLTLFAVRRRRRPRRSVQAG